VLCNNPKAVRAALPHQLSANSEKKKMTFTDACTVLMLQVLAGSQEPLRETVLEEPRAEDELH
jgi:hypothetical protein